MCKLYEIQKIRTTAYHPDDNGQTERFNQKLHELLQILSPEKKKHWSDHLLDVTYTSKVSPNSSTGYSPFHLFFGREQKVPLI